MKTNIKILILNEILKKIDKKSLLEGIGAIAHAGTEALQKLAASIAKDDALIRLVSQIGTPTKPEFNLAQRNTLIGFWSAAGIEVTENTFKSIGGGKFVLELIADGGGAGGLQKLIEDVKIKLKIADDATAFDLIRKPNNLVSSVDAAKAAVGLTEVAKFFTDIKIDDMAKKFGQARATALRGGTSVDAYLREAVDYVENELRTNVSGRNLIRDGMTPEFFKEILPSYGQKMIDWLSEPKNLAKVNGLPPSAAGKTLYDVFFGTVPRATITLSPAIIAVGAILYNLFVSKKKSRA